MSIETWKAEFYPVSAQQCLTADVLEHSILKWRGLQKTNMARHGVKKHWATIKDANNHVLRIDCNSCALCVRYQNFHRPHPSTCSACPIYKTHGRKCSDEYVAWTDNGDPKPMLKLLRATKL